MSREPVAPTRIRRAAILKTDGRCWYCGVDGAEDVEHQLPITRGGAFVEDNCVLSCRSCNSTKARRAPEEFKVYLLIQHGRPPEPFYGENPHPSKRDWIIVCDTPVEVPRMRDIRAAKMATYGAPV